MIQDSQTIRWKPDSSLLKSCQLSHYYDWLGPEVSKVPKYDYEAFWQWSVDNLETFWESLLGYFDVRYDGSYSKVISGDRIDEASWFEGISLNYAEHVFRNATRQRPALISAREDKPVYGIEWEELLQQVAALQQVLAKAGVGPGDRVAGFLPNVEHSVIAFLATAGLGAVWSCCSPEFGAEAVRDRFEQIDPR